MFRHALHLFIFSLCSIFSLNAQAQPSNDEAKIAALFTAAGATGVFVLYDLQTGSLLVSDAQRGEQRFTPASTFKMLNALIALQTGAVSGPDEVFKWDGQPRFIKSWERDLTLSEAMAESAVPIYQEVARRIGQQRMQHFVSATNFGNNNIGQAIDRFWLDGPLAISAIEQARFSARLAQGQLPFDQAVQATVRDMLAREKTARYSLFGKTGWATNQQPMIGWYSGWVERADGQRFAFALNMNIASSAELGKRQALVKAALSTLKIIPATAAQP
ncbi:MAG: class D beta-lactamase [Pseudomonas sp.]|nr:class D beta-lactamase [Pseudomonas sp.]